MLRLEKYWLEQATGESRPLAEEDAERLRAVFERFGIGDLLTIRDEDGVLTATMRWIRRRFERRRSLNTGAEGVIPLVRVMRDHFMPAAFALDGLVGTSRVPGRRARWEIWGAPRGQKTGGVFWYTKAGRCYSGDEVEAL